MDANTFRWVLIVIAVLLAIGIYLYGLHQGRLRKRSADETLTREEIESAFVEDEQLDAELNNLNQILKDNDDEDFDEILVSPATEEKQSPLASPDPEIFVPKMLAAKDEDRLVSYHLRHGDFRLITGEEADAAMQDAGLELNAEGLLEFRQQGEVAFQVASLTAPGNFRGIEKLEFATLGFNCFIDLDLCQHPRPAFEAMLKKIDELVRLLNVEVYTSNQDLLTISEVTSVREKLA
ncbi:MAG: cell division protein ZipA C-terminal FtsZ-binding domain-containing protein [Gammaproteobacteria bacterium]|nr:cell division protein ZipA C-terminal FtsZ-binding domain-containing protein [Gammaproteobacteria bacterium]